MDRYRDIDHVYPLAVYPELAFDYDNYVYSCVICNQNRKRERCSVIIGGEVLNLESFCRHDIALPNGAKGLINPRTENPEDFFEIDLETGVILVKEGLSDLDDMRASYTIEVLHLNDPNLARDRRFSFRLYLELACDLGAALENGENERIDRLLADFLSIGRPTVLHSMMIQPGRFEAFSTTIDAISERYEVEKEELFLG